MDSTSGPLGAVDVGGTTPLMRHKFAAIHGSDRQRSDRRPSDRRPNVLLLYTDQQRWDTLGANGNRVIHTPHLDALASGGVTFINHFVQHPLCMPSRISMLSGRYPGTLRITHMGVPVPQSLPTLPHLLGQAGYHRANIGKLHFLPHANRDHTLPHPAYGFDHLELAEEPGVYDDAYAAWLRRIAPDAAAKLAVGNPPARAIWEQLLELADGASEGAAVPREDYADVTPQPFAEDLTHSAFVGRRTQAYLRARAGDETPFLCIAGFFAPHAPLVVPQRFLDCYDRQSLPLPDYPAEVEAVRRADTSGLFTDEHLRMVTHGYYALISEVDHHVGAILDTLEQTGLAEDTVVALLSDHGEWLGDHLRYAKGYPGDDSVSRVPLVVAGPGVAMRGRQTDVIESVDVVPTILDLLGLPVPSDLQGRSLHPLLTGRGSAAGSVGALMEANGWKTLRTATHRYLIHDDGRESLWDLRDDPGEYHDIAVDQPDVVVSMRGLLLSKLLAIERPLPRAFAY